jgi:hypothetical protein
VRIQLARQMPDMVFTDLQRSTIGFLHPGPGTRS